MACPERARVLGGVAQPSLVSQRSYPLSDSQRTDAASFSQPRESVGHSPRPRETEETAQGAGGADGNTSGPTDLSEIGHEAVSQAQEQAVKIVSQAREQVTANVKTQTTRGANIATVLSASLHDAGTQLRQQDEEAVATYLDQAAGQVEQIGAMLDKQEYGKLIGTVQGFARRQPVLFFAAAVAVGVAGARFLRSSTPQSQSQYQRGPDAYAGLRNMQDSNDRRAGGYA